MANAPDPKQMARMSWDDLYMMRLDPSLQGRDTQNLIAPYEHRAYAREQVRDNLGKAGLMALMIPGYQAFKSVKGRSRSGASLDQIQQGLLGVGEGALLNLMDKPEQIKKGLLSMF